MFAYNILIVHKMIIHVFIIIVLIWKKNSNMHKAFFVYIVKRLYIVKGIKIWLEILQKVIKWWGFQINVKYYWTQNSKNDICKLNIVI
jgi:hypothetical protein